MPRERVFFPAGDLWPIIPWVHEAASATATFLFTDIEGSTQVLRAHRAEYARILADHHSLLREQFAAYGGREIDNQGDSFFVAFTRARDAVLAAAACQRALAGHSWPDGATVRVRMGIHTGEAELAVDRYVGMSIHRAARISAAGHGGQILLSQTTAGLLEDEESFPGLELRDLGVHRVKDITQPVRLYQLEIEGLRKSFPPLAVERPGPPGGRKRLAALGVAAVLLTAAAAAVLLLTLGGGTAPKVIPNSVVRIDPATLKVKQVVAVGDAPDLVVDAGEYVWVTHYVLRDGAGAAGLRNAGDRTLTRVDPASGKVTVVGGGLAPCGITGDPSGDVWVANCFEAGSGQQPNVVRIDANTLAFKAAWPVPGAPTYYRGLAYGGGSLWVSDPSGKGVAEVDPRTGKRTQFPLANSAGALAWAEGYGDLWITNFNEGSLTRLHPATGASRVIRAVAANPGSVVVDGDTVWVGDWTQPGVERLAAVGSSAPRNIPLAVAGVWTVAAGGGYVWATTPEDRSLWRIDAKTNHVTRIAMPYSPSGVTANADEVWVTVRGR